MELSGLTKLIVCTLVIIAAIVLGVTKTLDGEAVVGLLSGALGYVYGNGHGIISAKINSKRSGKFE